MPGLRLAGAGRIQHIPIYCRRGLKETSAFARTVLHGPATYDSHKFFYTVLHKGSSLLFVAIYD